MKPRLMYSFATVHNAAPGYWASLGVLLASVLFSPAAYSATELSDRALRHQTETNHSLGNVPEVLDCTKDMSKAECNRLQYENYANQTDRSYDEFLKTETTDPLRNRVIKQPLLTQPLEKPGVPEEPRPNLNNLFNQLPMVPERIPATGPGVQP